MNDDKLNVAIVHYHMRTGGVRSVIDNTLLSLEGSGVNLAVIAGEDADSENAPKLPCRTPLGIVEGLKYGNDLCAGSGTDLTKELQLAARRLLGAAPDLWHFHNHCLGKNPALPPAVRKIAEDGAPVLLQIHDFAEDGRPGLYNRMLKNIGQNDFAKLGHHIYPAADHVHYALINKRDVGFVAGAGNCGNNTHHLPNPVSMNAHADFPGPEANAAQSNRIIYPTRGIRRKNVGEILLWAAVAGEDLRFALTRAPKNPEQQDAYKRWKKLAEELELPVCFELGEIPGVSYESLISCAHSIITTSVAEGFGLCFLEPFLARKSISGRRLPEVTEDFASNGIELTNLYEKLLVPVDLVGREKLKERLQNGLKRFYSSYGIELTPDIVDSVENSFFLKDTVDFGRLDEPLQEKVVRHMKENKFDRNLLDPARLLLSRRETVEKNKGIIEENYNLDSYGARLMDIYCRVAGSKTKRRVGSLSGRRLLDFFLAPERFSLLRA